MHLLSECAPSKFSSSNKRNISNLITMHYFDFGLYFRALSFICVVVLIPGYVDCYRGVGFSMPLRHRFEAVHHISCGFLIVILSYYCIIDSKLIFYSQCSLSCFYFHCYLLHKVSKHCNIIWHYFFFLLISMARRCAGQGEANFLRKNCFRTNLKIRKAKTWNYWETMLLIKVF